MTRRLALNVEQATASAADTELVKGLGLFDSTMIVVGSMIGSGIFIVSADIAHQVQSPGLCSLFGLCWRDDLIGALSYGELAAAMPHAGGQYVYLRESLGPALGFSIRLDDAAGDSNGDHRRRGDRVCEIHRA